MFRGGAFAIGVAATIPHLVEKIGAFASISPYGSVDTTGTEIDEFPLFVKHPFYIWRSTFYRRLLYTLPAPLLRFFLFNSSSLTKLDRETFNVDFIHVMKNSFREALKHGTDGLFNDLKYYLFGWKQTQPLKATAPILIFHGTRDSMTPVSCTEWYASKLPNCKAVYFENENHFNVLVLHKREMFDWLED